MQKISAIYSHPGPPRNCSHPAAQPPPPPPPQQGWGLELPGCWEQGSRGDPLLLVVHSHITSGDSK